MRRPDHPNLLHWILTAAVALLPAAPLRAGWVCPDGTPCVPRQQTCCTAPRADAPTGSCCQETRAAPCRHDARAAGRSDAPVMAAAGMCRFHTVSQAAAPARPELRQAGPHSPPAPWADAPQIAAPTRPGPQAPGEALAFRPPPLPSAGPSRAPPLSP